TTQEIDFKQAPFLRIAGQFIEHSHHDGPYRPERVRFVRQHGLPQQGIERHPPALGHRNEDVVLVFEMPVDGAAGHSGFGGNVIQRGAGDPLAMEHQLRRVKNLLSGFHGFSLGAPCHRVLPLLPFFRPDGRFVTAATIHTFANVCIVPATQHPARLTSPSRTVTADRALTRHRLPMTAPRKIQVEVPMRSGQIRPGLALMLTALLAACSDSAPGPGQQQAPEVGYITVQSQSVTLQRELPGRTNPHQIAEVRPQVTGVIRERLFEEGAEVKAGAPLYQIDDRLYRAAVASAQADLARARAASESARLTIQRFDRL